MWGLSDLGYFYPVVPLSQDEKLLKGLIISEDSSLTEAVLEWISVDLSLWEAKCSLRWVKCLQVPITNVSFCLYNGFLLLRGVYTEYLVFFLIYSPEFLCHFPPTVKRESKQRQSDKYSFFFLLLVTKWVCMPFKNKQKLFLRFLC